MLQGNHLMQAGTLSLCKHNRKDGERSAKQGESFQGCMIYDVELYDLVSLTVRAL